MFIRLLSAFLPNVQNVATDILAIVTEWVTGLVTLVIFVINAFIELFYAAPDGVGEKEITFIGILALLGLAMTFVTMGLSYLKRLFG